MRLVAIALIAGCSGMPDVNGNTLGESGHAKLSVSPDKTSVNGLGTDLVVTNSGDGASGAIGARLVDDDASWFAITRSDCSELQPGGSCPIGVVFAPGAAATTGKTTLEIDDDNEQQTTAELDGKIEPAIRWMESSAPMSAQACTLAGPGELISTKLHLLYTGVNVGGVQVTSSDSHYTLVNSCIGALGTMGSCDVTVSVHRGDLTAMVPAQATITATLGSLTTTVVASFQLQACDLVLAPDPLNLDAANPSGIVTLTNQSTTNSHTLASAVLANNNVLTVPDSDCKMGLVIPPGGSCSARFMYNVSSTPPNDKSSVTYTVITNDAMPEPLSVTGTVNIGLADNRIHFEKDTYSWDNVTAGAQAQPMSIKILTATGVTSAGPLMINVYPNTAWMIDNGSVGTCGAMFSTGCMFQLDFTATTVAGTYNAVLVAKGMNGELAFAALKAKVN